MWEQLLLQYSQFDLTDLVTIPMLCSAMDTDHPK